MSKHLPNNENSFFHFVNKHKIDSVIFEKQKLKKNMYAQDKIDAARSNLHVEYIELRQDVDKFAASCSNACFWDIHKL